MSESKMEYIVHSSKLKPINTICYVCGNRIKDGNRVQVEHFFDKGEVKHKVRCRFCEEPRWE